MGSRYESDDVRKSVPLPIRRFLRKERRAHHAVAASESSRAKGMIRTPMDRSIIKRGRSYKWREYAAWCRKYNGIKRPSKSST